MNHEILLWTAVSIFMGDGHLHFFTCKWDRHLCFKLSGHLRFQIWHTCVKTDVPLRFLPVHLNTDFTCYSIKR